MNISEKIPTEIETGRGGKVLNKIQHLYFTNYTKNNINQNNGCHVHRG